MFKINFSWQSTWLMTLILVSQSSFAFVEQVLSYQEKYKTSLGLFSASGKFQETAEESEMEMTGVGLFGEISLRRAPWTLRVDTYSTQRKTGNEGLSVKNIYREFRVWGLGFVEMGDVFSLFGGLGAGVLYPETKMSVLGQSKLLPGQSNALGAYLLGMRWRIPVGVFFDLWSQTSYAPVYPNGNLTSFAMALGFQF